MYDNPTFIPVLNLGLTDIKPISTGYEDCHPMKHNHAGRYSHVLIHFVERGQGIFISEGKKHSVKAGQIFIVNPNELCEWYPNPDDPWFYRWISFSGGLSYKFKNLPCVMDYKPDIFRRANEIENYSGYKSYLLTGLIFELIADIFSDILSPINHVEEIKSFIDSNYRKDITVKQIAKMLDRNPKYLTTIFKRETGKSIHEYITYIRLETAKFSIINGVNITTAALDCGYSDVANFSKSFKNNFGFSPTEWIKQEKSK
ncbi:MAG: AraC family transcriptional regulator [Clostridia bacterium]|nr:AraC family transcriptional regulator [Clostridia bacterium]